MKKISENQKSDGDQEPAKKDGRGGAREGAGRKPGVVSEAKRTFAAAARENADEALEILLTVARDETAAPAARVSAANSIIDRAYGKPLSALEVTGKDGGAIEHAIKAKIVMVPPKEQAEVSTRQMPSDDGDPA